MHIPVLTYNENLAEPRGVTASTRLRQVDVKGPTHNLTLRRHWKRRPVPETPKRNNTLGGIVSNADFRAEQTARLRLVLPSVSSRF